MQPPVELALPSRSGDKWRGCDGVDWGASSAGSENDARDVPRAMSRVTLWAVLPLVQMDRERVERAVEKERDRVGTAQE